LKTMVMGERKAIIPVGRRTPALAQYYNSDPRPRLLLYRGSAEPGGADHFLGAFEVMGVPESPNVNVSTLFVLNEGRLIICARDNQRDMFLEIRRLPDGDTK